MLTKYKNVRLKKDAKKPLKNVFISMAYAENFFWERTPKLDIFSCVVFFGRIILKHVKNQKDSRGVRGHAPPKNF